ncbi:cold-shock protein [Xanthobacter sediminis]
MTAGTVKWFNAQKGLWIYRPRSGGSDAFVHISAVERAGLSDLHESQKIGFEFVTGSRSGKPAADKLQDLS